MSKQTDTTEIETADNAVDVKGTLIRIATMTGVAAVSIVATALVIKQIEKRDNE